MLEESSHSREVQIISRNNCRQRQTQSIANKLQRDIVDVGTMTRQEDYALLILLGLLCYRS
jgi:hypothetical protein